MSTDEEDSIHTMKSSSFRKEFIKSIKISENPLCVIKSVDDFVMVSDTAGQIRFYDKELIIIFWCPSNDAIDSITTIEFDLKRQVEASTEKANFPIRDFLVRKFLCNFEFENTIFV